MQRNGNSPLTPRQGVYLVGIFNLLASLMATWTVKKFGRKTLLVWGHIGIALAHSGVAAFSLWGVDIGVLIMILSFLVIYLNTSGPISWIYASETTIDAAMGICLLVLWGTVFILSLICPIMMNPHSIGPTGSFLILAGLSVLGTLYNWYFLKET